MCLANLQHVGVDVETDVGEILLSTEPWDVPAYLVDRDKTVTRHTHSETFYADFKTCCVYSVKPLTEKICVLIITL